MFLSTSGKTRERDPSVLAPFTLFYVFPPNGKRSFLLTPLCIRVYMSVGVGDLRFGGTQIEAKKVLFLSFGRVKPKQMKGRKRT